MSGRLLEGGAPKRGTLGATMVREVDIAKLIIDGPDGVRARAGQGLRFSDWLEITQERVNSIHIFTSISEVARHAKLTRSAPAKPRTGRTHPPNIHAANGSHLAQKRK